MAQFHRFGEDRHGSVLVEYAITLPLFLVLLVGVIDFGQIYLRWILAEKATQIAARLAVVRPPACGGVPAINLRPALDAADVLFGTSCSDGNDVCAAPLAITCDGGSDVGATLDEVFATIAPFLPSNATAADLSITYDYAELGFLGGPFIPLVTVELDPGIEIPFITPLGPLLAAFYGGAGLAPTSLPPMRTSLPGEDLALGGAGWALCNPICGRAVSRGNGDHHQHAGSGPQQRAEERALRSFDGAQRHHAEDRDRRSQGDERQLPGAARPCRHFPGRP
jgi:hypothetical protein